LIDRLVQENPQAVVLGEEVRGVDHYAIGMAWA
jgi:hypothetical protein